MTKTSIEIFESGNGYCHIKHKRYHDPTFTGGNHEMLLKYAHNSSYVTDSPMQPVISEEKDYVEDILMDKTFNL